MQEFNYQALQKDGTIRQGILSAPTQMDLADELHKEGLLVVSITPRKIVGTIKTESILQAGRAGQAVKKFLDMVSEYRLRQARVKFNDMMFFLTQLSSMVGSGLPLVSVLNTLADDSDNRTLKSILTNVISSIEAGLSFSEAMAVFPNIFDKVFASLVRAGEISGKLDQTLEQATTYMEKTNTMRQKVKQAMMYPVIILCIFVLISVVLIAFIVPQFESLFNKLGSDLPVATQVLILINTIIRQHFFMTFTCLAGIVVCIIMLMQVEQCRYYIDKITLRLPLFGQFVTRATMGKLARTLGILLGSGVTTTVALEQLSNITGNRHIQRSLLEAIEDVKNGKSLSEALRATGVFPTLVVQMTSSGEDAGTLPEMLAKVADHYEKQIEYQVNTLSATIEPIMIVCMAVVVAGILFAIYLPIFKLGRAIKGM